MQFPKVSTARVFNKNGIYKNHFFFLSRNRKNHSQQNNVLLSGRFMHRKNCTVKMLTAKEKHKILSLLQGTYLHLKCLIFTLFISILTICITAICCIIF